MTVAVILASGKGQRFGGPEPKQFLPLDGKTVLEHSVDAFNRNAAIDEICVVTRPEYVERVTALTRDIYNKVRRVIVGGRERYDSSIAAIRAYPDPEARLLLHDAVRPWVSQDIITRCARALDDYEAVEVAVAATDTMIEVDDAGHVTRIPPRHTLRNVQTPQGFRRDTIAEAYRRAMADPAFQPTDDCSVVFRYLPATQIKVVEGEPRNKKITYPGDL